MLFHQLLPMPRGIDSEVHARVLKPPRSRRNMPYFVPVDTLKNRCARRIPLFVKPRNRRGRYIEPARLQHHGHNGEPSDRIMRSLFCRFPKPVMCGESTIEAPQLPQATVEQSKMHRFIRTHAQPIIGKIARKLAAEPAHHVKSEIDRDKFDVREGMEQCHASAL